MGEALRAFASVTRQTPWETKSFGDKGARSFGIRSRSPSPGGRDRLGVYQPPSEAMNRERELGLDRRETG